MCHKNVELFIHILFFQKFYKILQELIILLH